MTAEEQIARLEEQLTQVLEQLRKEDGELQGGEEELGVGQGGSEEMEKQKTAAPSFVKANVKKPQESQKKARKKRDTKYNQARRRSTPTQIVEHRLVHCPECHLRLGGITLARLREVIDVPSPPPVEVTEHRLYKGWCAGCGKWYEAPVDWHEQVLGQGRIGVRLASIIAYLRTGRRLPLRQLRDYLRTVHGFRVSVGEIVELLHRIKQHVQPTLDALKEEIPASPPAPPNETGSRENASHGYT